MKVIHIDFPPHRDSTGKLSVVDGTPPSLQDDSFTHSARNRIPPPREAFDFLPDLIAEKEGSKFKIRDDVKPLHIVQPEGVSFSMNGNELSWQKWKMHIGKEIIGQHCRHPNLCIVSFQSSGRHCTINNHLQRQRRSPPHFLQAVPRGDGGALRCT